jgi:hypothetical protein
LFRLSIQRPSFLKTKKEESEVSTTATKVPRNGFLGKMGLKKKSKAIAEEPVEPVEETPVVEKAPTEAEEAPVDAPEDEAVEEREDEAEEPAEEEPAEEAPVDEAAADESREEAPVEPSTPTEPVSTGFLCGCV